MLMRLANWMYRRWGAGGGSTVLDVDYGMLALLLDWPEDYSDCVSPLVSDHPPKLNSLAEDCEALGLLRVSDWLTHRAQSIQIRALQPVAPALAVGGEGVSAGG